MDRNILRMAIFEMMQGETPGAIVIDEAIELARKFSGDESAPFVNGVLDSIRKELETENKRDVGSVTFRCRTWRRCDSRCRPPSWPR